MILVESLQFMFEPSKMNAFLNMTSRLKQSFAKWTRWSLNIKLLTFTSGHEQITAGKSKYIPVIFSFFWTTVEQIKRWSLCRAFFGTSYIGETRILCNTWVRGKNHVDYIILYSDWSHKKQRERNVVQMWAAVCGEERCVTTLKTAARETILRHACDTIVVQCFLIIEQ